MAMGRKLNNSTRKNDKNQISSYVSSRPKWLPTTEISGPWDEYPWRRSCARNQVTRYNLEQSDWFGINYHIGILVYIDDILTTDACTAHFTLLHLNRIWYQFFKIFTHLANIPDIQIMYLVYMCLVANFFVHTVCHDSLSQQYHSALIDSLNTAQCDTVTGLNML